MSRGITASTSAISISVRLARFAGARLIRDEAIGLDRGQRAVLCRGHPPIRYDLLSIDIGSTPRLDDVPGAAEHTVPVKPIDRFAERWEALLARAGARPGCGSRWSAAAPAGSSSPSRRSIGWPTAGAARSRSLPASALLPSHNAGCGACFARTPRRARHPGRRRQTPVVRVEPGRLILADGGAIEFDEALWVTEAAAAPWLAETGLPLDARRLYRDR